MIKKLPASFTITNCYDSHVHWQATGAVSKRLDLSNIRSPSEIQQLRVQPENLIGDWLEGFGWDDNLWPNKDGLHRQTLDQVFGSRPVKMNRTDFHAAWVNTEALRRAGLFYQNVPDPDGGRILKDGSGWPTGVLIDLAMSSVDKLIPRSSEQQVLQNLIAGMKLFNRAGFTHIRDLTCDETEWNAKVHLAQTGQLTLAVEQNFHTSSPDDFSAALRLALHSRRNHPALIRPVGIKIFLDGALGSEGAYISHPYASGSGRGLVLIERIALKEIMAETWSHGLEIAIHCIGDEAAHLAVTVATELWDLGSEGILNIEHAQLLRPETMDKMKGRSVVCHMQPCHWLSDRRWLKEKIPGLFNCLFPWAELEKRSIPFLFGSDSPIESTAVARNLEAMLDAEKSDIPFTQKPMIIFHQHPNSKWPGQTFTEFTEGHPTRLVFAGQVVDLTSMDH